MKMNLYRNYCTYKGETWEVLRRFTCKDGAAAVWIKQGCISMRVGAHEIAEIEQAKRDAS